MNGGILRLSSEIAKFITTTAKCSVQVRPSTVCGAGSGLFTSTTVTKYEILTLYPGVYVPGIPNGHVVDPDHDNDVVFLGGITTPSGKTGPENAYILNLQGNGYIDGLALETCDNGRRLLWSDRALGHLINHHPCPNVYVTPFCWSDVDIVSSGGDDDDDKLLLLPNVVRADGSPRCLVGDDLMVYDNAAGKVFGAAIQASEDLGAGQELFMDYGLTEPYPAWAKGWYNSQ